MNPITSHPCQHHSSEECQTNIRLIQTEWQEKNILLILPSEYPAIETCEKLHKEPLFSGILVLDNFGDKLPKIIEFKLIRRDTPIKVIKENVCNYLSKKTSDLALALFPTSAALKNEDDLFNTLNFHGLGGEVIHLRNLSQRNPEESFK
ncbi:hypothetical protein [Candidatus Protochlamydia phocaeensis]|uniref:hypothetical protein n=1 Tax=Candidatus Protochlamydia phocaeensis TaxID=1414722 RepID=UPI000837F06F|nr:hypothetical protein [Candidatus Protochlamydia phocaeensis]